MNSKNSKNNKNKENEAKGATTELNCGQTEITSNNTNNKHKQIKNDRN